MLFWKIGLRWPPNERSNRSKEGASLSLRFFLSFNNTKASELEGTVSTMDRLWSCTFDFKTPYCHLLGKLLVWLYLYQGGNPGLVVMVRDFRPGGHEFASQRWIISHIYFLYKNVLKFAITERRFNRGRGGQFLKNHFGLFETDIACLAILNLNTDVTPFPVEMKGC